MVFRLSNTLTRPTRPKKRLSKAVLLVLLPVLIASCSTQPLTLEQELTGTAIAGAIGAGVGAFLGSQHVFVNKAHESYPISIAIGAAAFAGIFLLYEEVKREAAQENTPDRPDDLRSNPSP